MKRKAIQDSDDEKWPEEVEDLPGATDSEPESDSIDKDPEYSLYSKYSIQGDPGPSRPFEERNAWRRSLPKGEYSVVIRIL